MALKILLLSVLAAGVLPFCAIGERVTIPAVASIEGGAPFFSDVRVFNTSYREVRLVTVVYRCFLGQCPTQTPSKSLSIGPRESVALDDICARFFEAPDSAGAVEFEDAGAPEGGLIVTSRLYATAAASSVGMLVPGVGSTMARRRSVLTSIRNRGPGPRFRTNVGAFNTTDLPATMVVRVFERGVLVGSVSASLGPRSGTQINDIYSAVGQVLLETSNGVVTVEASGEVVGYAAIIDNATSDPTFVLGAPDAPLPGTPPPTPTPSGTATPSPTPGGPLHTVHVGPGFQFVDQESGGNVSTIPSGTTIEWIWVGGGHSSTSGPCVGGLCTPDGLWSSPVQTDGTFRFQFTTPGTYPYFCSPHSEQMQGTVVVMN